MSDDLDWGAFESSQYMKFEEPGDSISGTITKVYPGTDYNGNPCPVLDLNVGEGEERTVSCGQANLKAQVTALKPKVLDTITITFTHTEQAEKGKRKVFKIEHVPGPGF